MSSRKSRHRNEVSNLIHLARNFEMTRFKQHFPWVVFVATITAQPVLVHVASANFADSAFLEKPQVVNRTLENSLFGSTIVPFL